MRLSHSKPGFHCRRINNKYVLSDSYRHVAKVQIAHRYDTYLPGNLIEVFNEVQINIKSQKLFHGFSHILSK